MLHSEAATRTLVESATCTNKQVNAPERARRNSQPAWRQLIMTCFLARPVLFPACVFGLYPPGMGRTSWTCPHPYAEHVQPTLGRRLRPERTTATPRNPWRKPPTGMQSETRDRRAMHTRCTVHTDRRVRLHAAPLCKNPNLRYLGSAACTTTSIAGLASYAPVVLWFSVEWSACSASCSAWRSYCHLASGGRSTSKKENAEKSNCLPLP